MELHELSPIADGPVVSICNGQWSDLTILADPCNDAETRVSPSPTENINSIAISTGR